MTTTPEEETNMTVRTPSEIQAARRRAARRQIAVDVAILAIVAIVVAAPLIVVL